MRVLMVSKACLVGTYQSKLEKIGSNRGIELGVIVPTEWRDRAGTLKFEPLHTSGYQLWVDPIRFNGSYHLHYYHTLNKRIDQFRPDIIHMDEEPYNLATWLALKAAQRRKIRFLFFTWQNLYRRYPPPFRWMEQQVLSESDFGIMGNRDAADVFKRKGYKGPQAILPQFGISPYSFYPPKESRPPLSARTGSGGTQARYVVGYAGRFVPEKGVDLLIKSLGDIKHLPWELRLAGTGPDQAALEAQIGKSGLQDRVTFFGSLPSADMPHFLRQLDILVLPSLTQTNWKEQFGRILIEAMATEVVVLGSDSGEIPHVIGEGGLTFAEGNRLDLAEKLSKLMVSDQLRRELGLKGRARVLANYTQEKIAAQTIAIYQSIF